MAAASMNNNLSLQRFCGRLISMARLRTRTWVGADDGADDGDASALDASAALNSSAVA